MRCGSSLPAQPRRCRGVRFVRLPVRQGDRCRATSWWRTPRSAGPTPSRSALDRLPSGLGWCRWGADLSGWYSYDGLDNSGVPSADRILPEFQQVRVGDILPQTPTAEDRFVVRVVEPERALVLGDSAGSMSWAFVLAPVDETSTRLITRSRGAYDHLALGLLLKVVWHPVHFGMQRRQLLNLKRLVEAATCGTPTRNQDEADLRALATLN
jgi:hypothetical protein